MYTTIMDCISKRFSKLTVLYSTKLKIFFRKVRYAINSILKNTAFYKLKVGRPFVLSLINIE